MSINGQQVQEYDESGDQRAKRTLNQPRGDTPGRGRITNSRPLSMLELVGREGAT